MKAELIYYLDDDSDDQTFFTEATSGLKLEVVLFDSAEELLQKLVLPRVPSAVFLDINMPGKDGFSVLKEIRSMKDKERLPVIMFSTSTSDSCIDRCFKLGASFYLTKPTCLKALRNSVTGILETPWDSFVPSRKNFVYRPKN